MGLALLIFGFEVQYPSLASVYFYCVSSQEDEGATLIVTAKFSVTRPRNIVLTFLEVNAQKNPILRSWCLSYDGFFL